MPLPSHPYYEPTDIDKDWARSMMKLIKDEGTLMMPQAQLIYQVNHKFKELSLNNVEQLLIFNSFVVHYQTIDVFQAIGYTVYPPKEKYDPTAIHNSN